MNETTPCLCTCPVCKGTGRQPVGPTQGYLRTYKMHGFDPLTDTIKCQNCGGQTMSGEPTGQSRLRPDGTPCIHIFESHQRGRCWTQFTCKHCGYSYDLDSSD